MRKLPPILAMAFALIGCKCDVEKCVDEGVEYRKAIKKDTTYDEIKYDR